MRRVRVAIVVITLAVVTVASVGVGLPVATPAAAASAKPALSASGSAAPAVVADDSAGDRSESAHPTFAAVYPNPVADGDRGEFVVLDAPPGTELDAYALTDGERTVALPERTVGGRVVLTDSPGVAANRTAGSQILLGAFPALANGGDRLALERGNRTVATLRYADAPEGETRRAGEWHPVAGTDRPVVVAGSGTARAFVLPDAPAASLAAVRNASDRVLLAGYTLTSRRVARALLNASDRGAEVRVLVDGAPVGGLPRRQAARLDSLAAAGIDVRVLAGPHAPYAFHHAKYVVADDRATVLTENWKPAGTGGRSSRGWGVTLSADDAVGALAATFRADAETLGTVDWSAFRRSRSFEPANATRGSYPAAVDPARVPYRNASVLVAPDNAASALVGRIDDAEESIAVVQVSVGSPRQPLLEAVIRAARRGVDVRILLSGAWYVADENRAVVERVNALADRESLPLEARIAQPGGRYGKIHAKGVVVDDSVVLGSMNWNNHSARENREVLVALDGPRVAAYYRTVFDGDWERRGALLPVTLPVALLVGAVACLLAARRLRFE